MISWYHCVHLDTTVSIMRWCLYEDLDVQNIHCSYAYGLWLGPWYTVYVFFSSTRNKTAILLTIDTYKSARIFNSDTNMSATPYKCITSENI